MSKVSFDEVIKENMVMVISPGTKKENRGYFTNFRVDRNTVPKDWYAYDIRTDDNGGGTFCTLESHVLVNHGGTFLTQKEIKFNKKYIKPYFSLLNRYGWTFEG